MEHKVYLKVAGDYGYDLVPYDKFKWTGRWKIETIKTKKNYPPGYTHERVEFDVSSKLYVERIFGIFFWWKIWEEESDFVFREEACDINDCNDPNRLKDNGII